MAIQYVFASLSEPAIVLQKMTILAKKIIFSDEPHFRLGGYVEKSKIVPLGAQKTRTQNEPLLGADFGPEA